MTRAAEPIAEVLGALLGTGQPVEVVAYDGSRSGPADAEVRVDIRSRKALSYLVTSPRDIGVARAYVSGELDVHGDLYTALRHFASSNVDDVRWAERMRVLRALDPKALRWAEPPAEENAGPIRRAVLGLRHSKRRDAVAISHHYDVSNRFYEWVLGPSMAYTCAVFPHADATLEQAQYEKFDLVARKLGLTSGMRLLDVGCGWGGMVMHAAKEYGVQALGVTLSRQQAEWAQKAIADAGLTDLAHVRHSDYRDVVEEGFDAVSSIGLTEHVGKRELTAYFSFLLSKLRPKGRLLNHCITRPTNMERTHVGRFIGRYVFPDGELCGVGHLISVMQDNGFEIRHEENLREHYAKTLAAWCANLNAHWDEAVAEVGQGRARVWALYMAGSRLGFDQNKIQLHQVLGVRTDDEDSGMPLRPNW